jgi:alpha-tubulin suppressor-like RCC1 family protein
MGKVTYYINIIFIKGYNYFGQIGDGSATTRATPVAVTMSGVLSGVTIVAVDGGQTQTVALSNNGLLYAWGGGGKLGDGTTGTDRYNPVAVNNTALSGYNITSIDVGNGHTLALSSSGQIFAFVMNLFLFTNVSGSQ